MFSKFSILLLSFIIVPNFILGETEDENQILSKSYDDCRKWLHIPLDSTITCDEFWLYMGKKKSHFAILSDYFDKNPTANEYKNFIDLYLYKELFKMLVAKLDLTVKKFDAHVKQIAAQRTKTDVLILGPVEPDD